MTKGWQAWLGIFLVAAQVAVFVVLAPRCKSPSLSVTVTGGLVAKQRSLTGHVVPKLASRTLQSWERYDGPGLHRVRWSIERRGGNSEAVAATQLVGPFQSSEQLACTARVVVGQALLQPIAGKLSAGSIAQVLAAELRTELRGTSIFGAGDFERLSELTIRFANKQHHPSDSGLLPAKLGAKVGYLRLTVTIEFERIKIKMKVLAVPQVSSQGITTELYSAAHVDFGNRWLQWAGDKLGVDRIATKFAKREIDSAVIAALAPPPPVALPFGGSLRFAYCNEQLDIVDGAYAALPLAVVWQPLAGQPQLAPPRFGAPTWPAVATDTTVALQVSLDGLNALMFELWRQKTFDQLLEAANIDQRFNEDPTVAEFLTLRISPPRLALPPVAMVQNGRTVVAAEAELNIADSAENNQLRRGHVWTKIDVDFAGSATASLTTLELTCEVAAKPALPSPELTSCYPLISTAVAARDADFSNTLTTVLRQTLASIFVGTELALEGIPAKIRFEGLQSTISKTPANAVIAIGLQATVIDSTAP